MLIAERNSDQSCSPASAMRTPTPALARSPLRASLITLVSTNYNGAGFSYGMAREIVVAGCGIGACRQHRARVLAVHANCRQHWSLEQQKLRSCGWPICRVQARMNFKTHRFGQPLQRVEGMVERLSTEQRRQVDALDTRSQGTSPPPLQPRQPGGLLGAMKTHDDFGAPLAN